MRRASLWAQREKKRTRKRPVKCHLAVGGDRVPPPRQKGCKSAHSLHLHPGADWPSVCSGESQNGWSSAGRWRPARFAYGRHRPLFFRTRLPPLIFSPSPPLPPLLCSKFQERQTTSKFNYLLWESKIYIFTWPRTPSRHRNHRQQSCYLSVYFRTRASNLVRAYIFITQSVARTCMIGQD